MKRWTATILFSALLAAAASGQAVTVTTSTRSIETQTFGYDWEFYGGDIDTASTTSTTGVFNDSVFVDLDEWYGGHVGTGFGSIASDLSTTAIEAFFDLYASCLDTGVYQADCSTVGRVDSDFTVSSRVRAQISFEAFCYDDYSWAFASLRKIGGSGSIATLDVFGNDDGGVSKTTWLQVGNYELYGEANCGAFGTYGTDDESTCVLNASVRFFHEADYNADGHVDLADKSSFLLAYSSGSLNADFNGNGVLNVTDRKQFLASWNAAHE